MRVDGEKTSQDAPSTVCTLEAPNKALQDVKDKHYSTWKLDSALPRFAETGFWHLGGRRMLAALRNKSKEHDDKTMRLINADDGGRTWHSPRPLTRIYGQAHGDLAALPGEGVVATFENRYPYADGGAILARVSWDGGQTWEPELYKLTRGHGYSGSVVLKDGTVVTLAEGEEGWGLEGSAKLRVGRPFLILCWDGIHPNNLSKCSVMVFT